MKKYAKIENETTKRVFVGMGDNHDFFKSIGMTEMDVVEGYDGNWYLAGFAPEKPREQIEVEALAQAKAERSEAVSNITVWVDGMEFDGDEESQQRVARSILALGDDEIMSWVLHDDTIAQVSKSQLKEVLRKAGQKQTELWTVPYLQH